MKAKGSKLRVSLQRVIKEHAGKPLEHRYTSLEAHDVLLEKLRLQPKELEKAKQLEAHSLRLQEAIAAVTSGVPITMRAARRIIQEAIREMPLFIERNRARIPSKGRADAELLLRNLKQDLATMRRVPDDDPTTLSPGFLKNALDFHMGELRALLGEKNSEDTQRQCLMCTEY